MDIYELFKSGLSFDAFVSTDTGSYRDRTLEIFNQINFDEEYIHKIKNINRKINVIICAEMWCPDCMINVPVLEKMRKYNDNINISIVGKEGNEEYFKKYAHGESVKIQTFVFYDEDFNEIGSIIEHPKKIKDIIANGNQPNIIVAMRKYRKGEYAQETLKDILEIL